MYYLSVILNLPDNLSSNINENLNWYFLCKYDIKWYIYLWCTVEIFLSAFWVFYICYLSDMCFKDMRKKIAIASNVCKLNKL